MMKTLSFLAIEQAVHALHQGKVIAYPTESVYGMGCVANDRAAVETLNALKQRPGDKGYIMLVASLSAAMEFVCDRSKAYLHNHPRALHGVTCVFPTSQGAPVWCQYQGKIALRISTHPECLALCKQLGKPLISTSCNVSGQPVLTNPAAIVQTFFDIAGIMQGEIGGRAPTRVVEPLTGRVFRA